MSRSSSDGVISTVSDLARTADKGDRRGVVETRQLTNAGFEVCPGGVEQQEVGADAAVGAVDELQATAEQLDALSGCERQARPEQRLKGVHVLVGGDALDRGVLDRALDVSPHRAAEVQDRRDAVVGQAPVKPVEVLKARGARPQPGVGDRREAQKPLRIGNQGRHR